MSAGFRPGAHINLNINFLMDPIVTGAVAQGAANVAGNVLDVFTWRNKLKKQTEAQKELMNLQQQMSQENYDYEQADKRNWNEYGEMLGKLSDVGINPLTFDGNVAGAGSANLGDAGIPGATDNSGLSLSMPNLLQAAIDKEDLRIRLERMRKENQVSDADIKVKLETCNNLIKEGKLTDTQEAKLHHDMAVAEKGLDLRAKELVVAKGNLNILKARLKLAQDSFDWQKNMDNKRLGIDYLNAQTQRYNARTAFERLNHDMARDSAEFEKGVAEMKAKLKSMGLNNYLKFIDTYRVKGPFGMEMPGRMSNVLLQSGIAIMQVMKDKNLSPKEKVEYMDKANALFDEFDLLRIDIPDSIPITRYFGKDGKFIPPKWTPPTLR